MTATEREPLTDRQRAIYRFLVAFWGRHGYPPTVREVCAAFGIASPNGVTCHLRALSEKGWIEWGEGDASRARGAVVPELRAAAGRAAAEHLESLGGK